jgi:hypothetical protein
VLDGYEPIRFDRMDAQAEQERATLQKPVVIINVGGGRGGERGAAGPPAAGARGVPGGRGPVAHDDPASPESRLLVAAVQTVPDRVREASPLTRPFLL